MSFLNSTALRVSFFALAATSCLPAADAITGQWMIDTIQGVDQVQLTLHRGDGRWNQTSSSAINLSNLQGLTRAQVDGGGGGTLRFQIVRDAGTFACEGYFKSGSGAGAFTFAPSSSFIADMRSLGYDGLSQETIFSMAVHDIGPRYVRELKALGLDHLSTDQLMAMSIHGVKPEYIRSLKDLGYTNLDADKLVAMRIHGVSIEFVRELKSMGFHATADQLVALRIHGATTEFVKQIRDLGFGPSIDELVAMRIHGVTPEFINELRARGMKNLTIDQLVSLRIHGIS